MFSDLCLLEYYNQIVIICIISYLLLTISFSTSLSTIERYDFPILNNLNVSNSSFIYYVIISSILCFDYVIGFYDFYPYLFLFILLISLTLFLTTSKEYIKSKGLDFFEYDILVNFSILGLILMNSCSDLIGFYIALEIQSLSFYVLANFRKDSQYCSESAIKYFILGALASGILLFSFVLLYICYGSFNFETIEQLSFALNDGLSFAGCLLFAISILFKLGAFPFHMWLIDVYEGAIISITALFSIVPKIIMLSFFIRIIIVIFPEQFITLFLFILLSGFFSVSFASIAALYQKRIKRLISYSTISHTGFMLLGLACLTIDSIKSCSIYIIIYSFMTLGVFSILFLSSLKHNQQKYLISWSSIFERNTAVSILLSILLFSIAGVPPFAGFYSKLCIFFSLLSKQQICIVILLAFFSAISCFYYIKLIKILFFNSGIRSAYWFGSGSKAIEFITSLILVFLIIFLLIPNTLVNCSSLAAISLYC